MPMLYISCDQLPLPMLSHPFHTRSTTDARILAPRLHFGPRICSPNLCNASFLFRTRDAAIYGVLARAARRRRRGEAMQELGIVIDTGECTDSI
jgi:hypothetical protein